MYEAIIKSNIFFQRNRISLKNPVLLKKKKPSKRLLKRGYKFKKKFKSLIRKFSRNLVIFKKKKKKVPFKKFLNLWKYYPIKNYKLFLTRKKRYGIKSKKRYIFKENSMKVNFLGRALYRHALYKIGPKISFFRRYNLRKFSSLLLF